RAVTNLRNVSSLICSTGGNWPDDTSDSSSTRVATKVSSNARAAVRTPARGLAARVARAARADLSASGLRGAFLRPLASASSARVASFAEAQGELNLHARIRLGGRGGQRRVEQRPALIFIEPAIGELERMNANGRVGVADEPLRVGRRECAELVERAQGNDDGGWFGVFIGKQFAQNSLCFLKRIRSMNLPLNRLPVTFSPIGEEG